MESRGLRSSTSNRSDALAAVKQIIEIHGIDPAELMVDPDDRSAELGTGRSFSKALYIQVAPFVGLDPAKGLKDIRTFEICRSRISTSLFKSIINGIDDMFLQYGAPFEHRTEEARSRFISPIFNHLILQFGNTIRNKPETMINGRIGTQGRVEYYFEVFGAVAVLCIEIKIKITNEDERLNMIAQVIIECDGCDLHNTKLEFFLPVYCILTDGLTYEFFKFERNPNPIFSHGRFSDDSVGSQRGLIVPDFSNQRDTLPFITGLRGACETIFDTMLNAYIASLKACRIRSEAMGRKEGSRRPSLDKWNQALKSGEDALMKFRQAEVQRQNGETGFADTTAQQAILCLEQSTQATPFYRNKHIMDDWDEDKVMKA